MIFKGKGILRRDTMRNISSLKVTCSAPPSGEVFLLDRENAIRVIKVVLGKDRVKGSSIVYLQRLFDLAYAYKFFKYKVRVVKRINERVIA